MPTSAAKVLEILLLMFKTLVKRLYPSQPMIDSTRAVGDSVVLNALRLKHLIVEALKAIAKCWAFFKDVHFSWFVIIPFLSQLAPFGEVSALLLWGLGFLPILIIITFRTLDSMFGLGSMDSSPQAWLSSRLSSAEPSIASNVPGRLHHRSYTPLTRTMMMPTRRHHTARPLRSRRSGLW
jgi:hypothetical protein